MSQYKHLDDTDTSSLQDDDDEIDVENDKQLDIKIRDHQNLIEEKMQRLQTNLKPDHDELLKIEEETKRLYDSITDKYKGITTEEIKLQMIPHLINI